MRRFSISQLTTMRWSLHQDVVRYLLHGFQSLGVWRHKIEEYDLLEVVDYLHEMKMGVSSVHWAGGFTGGNGLTYSDAIQDGMDAIDLTRQLEGDCLIVHPGCRNGHTSSHARRLLQSALKTLTPFAADYGVRLAIELMPCPSANNWTFMQRINGALELINEFPEEQLGIVLDLYHVGLNDEVFEALDQFASRINLVQLADRADEFESVERRLPLGKGNVPFEKWFRRLNQVGVNAVYEVELHGAGVANLDYDERLNSSAQFINSGPAAWTAWTLAPVTEQAQVRRPTNRKH